MATFIRTKIDGKMQMHEPVVGNFYSLHQHDDWKDIDENLGILRYMGGGTFVREDDQQITYIHSRQYLELSTPWPSFVATNQPDRSTVSVDVTREVIQTAVSALSAARLRLEEVCEAYGTPTPLSTFEALDAAKYKLEETLS